MAQTSVPAGSKLATKVFGAALFATTQRASGFTNNLTGAAPKQSDAEAKLKNQTVPEMPFVRVTDLAKTHGDAITVDLFHRIGGKPIMGDADAEGKGERLESSTQEIRIDLATKSVSAGGKMSQQRTLHNLRGIAMAQLKDYFMRLHDQTTLVHLSGARGSQGGQDWIIPGQADDDFADIMINPVLAPTYNRHFVADGANIVQGGANLASIDTTDVFKLEHVDILGAMLDDLDVKLQPVKIVDDPAANDEPLYLLYVSTRMWQSILTNTSGQVWRTFLQNAWNRKSYGSKHPLFTGEAGIWHNILIRKMPRVCRFFGGDQTRIVTQANAVSGTETSVTIPALSPGYAVDRGLLLGAQALAHVYGRNQQSEGFGGWLEELTNFKRNLEVAGEVMGGKSKLRFEYKDELGRKVPTDHGVIAFDAAVALQ